MDQQLSPVLVAALADAHQPRLAAGCPLTGNQTEPCRQVAPMLESLGLAGLSARVHYLARSAARSVPRRRLIHRVSRRSMTFSRKFLKRKGLVGEKTACLERKDSNF
jgi:hypothetical protein